MLYFLKYLHALGISLLGMTYVAHVFRAFAAMLLASSLTACGALGYLSDKVSSATDAMLGLNEPAAPDWSALLLVAAKGARDDRAATVDVVCVSDKNLSQTLSKTAAKDWFDNTDNLLATYAGKINVIRREIVPQQSLVISREALADCIGLTAHLFVDYTSDGLHAVNLDMSANGYKVFLDKSQFHITLTE
jgi:hypothetical protein